MKTRINKGNYGEGSITLHILSLALPTLLAELVNVLYSVVDRMYIGHIENVGTLALSGVGVVFPIISFISAFSSLISIGGAPIAAIERGKGDDRKATLIMETCLSFALIISCLLTILLFLFRLPLLSLMGADSQIIGYASDYFSIYVLGSVFVFISVGFNSFITMQGFGGIGMLTVLIGAILNTVLDPIFIYALSMGVKGAAVATVISQFVSALWVLLFLHSKKSKLRLERLSLDKAILLRVAKLGVSGFMFKMTNSLTQAASNMTLRVFGGSLSTLYIGAMSVINSTREMVSLPISAITSSAQPVISYNYGARKSDRVCKAIKSMTLMTLFYGILIWAFVLAFPQTLISIYTPDKDLINITIPVMRIFFAVFFMMALQSSGQTTFVALNRPRFAVFFSLLRKAILVFPLILILPHLGFGVNGVFLAEAISQLLGGSICYSTMYFVFYRKMKKGIDIDAS